MWRGMARAEMEHSSSFDYQHGRPGNENMPMRVATSGVSHQKASGSYSGDLRDAITGLHAKDVYESDMRNPGVGSGYPSDYKGPLETDLRNSISRSHREAGESNTSRGDSGPLKDLVSRNFQRDLRDIISGSNVREMWDSVGESGRELASSKEVMPDIYSRDLRKTLRSNQRNVDSSDHSARHVSYRDASSDAQHKREVKVDNYSRESSGCNLKDEEFVFLAKTLKESVDPNLGWSKGSSSSPFVGMESSRVSSDHVSDYKKSYKQNDASVTQSAPYILENSAVMMNMNPTPVSISSSAMKPHPMAGISSNPQLLQAGGIGVTNLYGGNDLMLLNPIHSRNQGVVSLAPVVMSAPVQIMETATVNKGAAVAIGGSFWDSIKKEGLLSYEKNHIKLQVESSELDTTRTVGEDFQMPSFPKKRVSDETRSRSRSPHRKSRSSSRRDIEVSRVSPSRERRYRHSVSPELRSKDRSSRTIREKSPRRDHLRSRSPTAERNYGRGHLLEKSRHSRERSPHLYRERSPRFRREISPRHLLRSKERSPHAVKEMSPRSGRERVQISRKTSPCVGERSHSSRDMSPRIFREKSPRISRERSPYCHRPRKEMTPEERRDLHRRFSPERSPRTGRSYSREKLWDMPREKDIRKRERSPLRYNSPGRSGYVRGHSRSPESVRYSRELTPEHKRYLTGRSSKYSPPPVRVLPPKHYPKEDYRDRSPAPVRILPAERVHRKAENPRSSSPHHYGGPYSESRYPRTNHSPPGRGPEALGSRERSPYLKTIDSPPQFAPNSPQVTSQSPHVARRGSEEDRESPRRSWDTRNVRKRQKRQKRGRSKRSNRGGCALVTIARSDSGSLKENHQTSSFEGSEDNFEDNDGSPLDLIDDASDISLESNDDEAFGKKDIRGNSPLFDEVSLSPKSNRGASPGTPISDEKPEALVNELQGGCSPVSLVDLPVDETIDDAGLPRSLSPVSLDEHSLEQMSGENRSRSKSPISDTSRGSLVVMDSVDVQDSPQIGEEKENEDLRVQLLRMREEKVELKLKKLEEESLETEMRLQNLSPDILVYSPQRDTPSPLLDECEDERSSESLGKKFYGY